KTSPCFSTAPDLTRRQVPVWHNSLLPRDTQMSMLSREDGANGSVLNSRWKKSSVFRLKEKLKHFRKVTVVLLFGEDHNESNDMVLPTAFYLQPSA
ncbi:MAG: hypothetical protein KKD01_05550, partial [Proteobacteria bacterium]|nr:hypothetical protein [Pseudomonadota bacterium]